VAVRRAEPLLPGPGGQLAGADHAGELGVLRGPSAPPRIEPAPRSRMLTPLPGRPLFRDSASPRGCPLGPGGAGWRAALPGTRRWIRGSGEQPPSHWADYSSARSSRTKLAPWAHAGSEPHSVNDPDLEDG
jgi:hypothetical protein